LARHLAHLTYSADGGSGLEVYDKEIEVPSDNSQLIIDLNDKIGGIRTEVAVLDERFETLAGQMADHSKSVTDTLDKIVERIDARPEPGDDDVGLVISLAKRHPSIAAALAMGAMTMISSLSGGAIARSDLKNIVKDVVDVSTRPYSSTPLSE
jgi:hypothetical protein